MCPSADIRRAITPLRLGAAIIEGRDGVRTFSCSLIDERSSESRVFYVVSTCERRACELARRESGALHATGAIEIFEGGKLVAVEKLEEHRRIEPVRAFGKWRLPSLRSH